MTRVLVGRSVVVSLAPAADAGQVRLTVVDDPHGTPVVMVVDDQHPFLFLLSVIDFDIVFLFLILVAHLSSLQIKREKC